MECSSDSNANEHSGTSVHRRDDPLAQQLANQLSIVTNSTILSSGIHTLYKVSPNTNRNIEEQEQVSPLGAWGFLPSPSENDQSSDCQTSPLKSHDSSRVSEHSSPLKSSDETKTEKIPLHEFTSRTLLLMANKSVKLDASRRSTTSAERDEGEEVYDRPRIILQKIQFDDPELFPPELTPDLVRRLSQENTQRSTRPRRSTHSSTTSLNQSPKKKRQRAESNDDYSCDNEKDEDYEDQPLRKRIRRSGEVKFNQNTANDAMSAFQKKTRDRLAHKA
ncbi:unnamed protein product, partial [Adineta ricciae]